MQSIDVCEAAEIIKKGGVVAFPTETVYGLGGDAFNVGAVAKIFIAKQRPRFDPLIVHIHEISQISSVADQVPDAAVALIDVFWPGPLTVVVPKSKNVPDLVTAGLPNVGIRMPAQEIALDLIRMSGTPIAAPSANKFGHISPTCAEHVHEQLEHSIDGILDGGKCSVGIESTIVSFTGKEPMLLRPGGVPMEEIEKIIGPLQIPDPDSHTNASPGRSLRHYAPRTPVFIGASPLLLPGLRKGLLTFTTGPEYLLEGFTMVEILSAKGDLNESASNLFAALRRLDQANLDVIIVKLVPNHGLGIAINDRLMRAAVASNEGKR